MSLAFHTSAWVNSQHHAVLLAGEMQRAALGQHAARVWGNRVVGGQGVDEVLWWDEGGKFKRIFKRVFFFLNFQVK